MYKGRKLCSTIMLLNLFKIYEQTKNAYDGEPITETKHTNKLKVRAYRWWDLFPTIFMLEDQIITGCGYSVYSRYLNLQNK